VQRRETWWGESFAYLSRSVAVHVTASMLSCFPPDYRDSGPCAPLQIPEVFRAFATWYAKKTEPSVHLTYLLNGRTSGAPFPSRSPPADPIRRHSITGEQMGPVSYNH